jgi:tryptophanyl-tRNA synthetase
MSKSYNNAVNLSDPPQTVYDKLSRMMTDPRRVRRTDPGDPKDCPAFQSLHEIYCTEEEKAELTVGCKTAAIGCLDCKKVMIKHVVADLEPIQARRRELEAHPGYVHEVLSDGAVRAREQADAVLAEAKAAMGL